MDIDDLQRVFRILVAKLPPGAVRDGFLAMKLDDLMQLDVEGPEWQRVLAALPPDARAAVEPRLLVATKPVQH